MGDGLEREKVTQGKKAAAPASEPAAENPAYERILGAAFTAFTERGYAGTSTLEIATRAQVSKRDLYANFSSKQAILVACIARRAERMRLSPDLPAPRSLQMLAETLRNYAATVIREVSQPAVMAMFRLAIAEAKQSSDVAQALDEARSVSRAALRDLLAEAQARKILNTGDTKHMAEQFFALVWGDLQLDLLLGVAASPKPAEIDKRADAATKAFLGLHKSIQTRKGGG
jgi:AcrR family transcriptional regulator